MTARTTKCKIGDVNADVLNNLAAIYQARGDETEAERLYRRALAIKKKIFGADNVDVAMTINNLAMLYKGAGRYDKAASLFRRAMKIFEHALEPIHPIVATCRENHADLLLYLRDVSGRGGSVGSRDRVTYCGSCVCGGFGPGG